MEIKICKLQDSNITCEQVLQNLFVEHTVQILKRIYFMEHEVLLLQILKRY